MSKLKLDEIEQYIKEDDIVEVESDVISDAEMANVNGLITTKMRKIAESRVGALSIDEKRHDRSVYGKRNTK
jgi:hypothetical protein